MASKVAKLVPRLGNKPIYLPNFTLTLLRTPELPPNFASFIVPLNLNKLDLRDYLWNAYGVPVHAVRSYIMQQKIRQDKPGAIRPAPRKWYRERAIKKMMVEMYEPFVWPAEPESYDQWDKKTLDAAKADRKEAESYGAQDARMKPTKSRASISEQAKELLAGKTQWKKNENTEVWEDVEEVEVEQDVKIPKIER